LIIIIVHRNKTIIQFNPERNNIAAVLIPGGNVQCSSDMNLYIASLTPFGVFGVLILGPECLEALVARLVTFFGDEDLVLDMILIK
jgi:hypothetical protein